MKNANLILHCGAAHVDRAVLPTVVTPEHTDTWYPIPHIDFITQVESALTAANMLTIPFSALRRNLPSALGIFPKRDGIWIVIISQGARFVLNIAVLALLILFSSM